MDDSYDELALNELRQRAMLYYGNNGDGAGVTEKMEEVLNSMFYDKPSDIYGHLANYFEKFALDPIISKLCSRGMLDSRAVSTVQVEVYCQVKGNQTLTASFVAPSACNVESGSVEERDQLELENAISIETAVELIASEISEMNKGLNPRNQEEIDARLTQKFSVLQDEEEAQKQFNNESPVAEEVLVPDSARVKGKPAKAGKSKASTTVIIPDEPPERMETGCEAVSAVSQAICKSAALLSGLPLYEHIARCRDVEKLEMFRLPLPVVTIMSCGKFGSGKLRCVREFMVIPSPEMPLSKAMKHISKIYNFCSRNLAGKAAASSPVRYTNNLGALCPQFDRPEQGLDLIQEAISSIGLTAGTDFHLGINCAGHDFFDYDKGKYEIVTGQLKTGDELAKFWSELISKYPALILLIDPLRKQEKESWMQLTEMVSSRCYIGGDYVYHRPGRLRDEILPADFKTSAIVLHMHQKNTVTDVLKCVQKMEDNGCQIVLSCSLGETNETFIADMAVGCNAKFLKLGGLCRGERVCKLNRLLEIECQLEANGRLSRWDGHDFPRSEPLDHVNSDHASSSRLSGLSPSSDKKPTKKSK